MSELTVVKVGGSLYDLPDLGERLYRWLGSVGGGPMLLVPGGGAAADAVRDLDRAHGLGEEEAHWLALRALALNAHFLQALLHQATIVTRPGGEELAILDALGFALADEGQPGCLPHCWAVTSDAIAARAAVVGGARRLVLLKSMTVPVTLAWDEAAARGFVDPWLPRVLREAPQGLIVEAVNLRSRS